MFLRRVAGVSASKANVPPALSPGCPLRVHAFRQPPPARVAWGAQIWVPGKKHWTTSTWRHKARPFFYPPLPGQAEAAARCQPRSRGRFRPCFHKPSNSETHVKLRVFCFRRASFSGLVTTTGPLTQNQNASIQEGGVQVKSDQLGTAKKQKERRPPHPKKKNHSFTKAL